MNPEEKKPLNLDTLDPRTLQALARQTDQELEALSTSFAALRAASNKFTTSKVSVKNLAKSGAGREVMVPLTSSLYVPGKVKTTEKVLVELGASYFAEKTPEEAMDYCQRNIDKLKESSLKLQGIIEVKRIQMQQIEVVFQKKVQEMQKAMGAAKAGA